jgi:hypothetical protein
MRFSVTYYARHDNWRKQFHRQRDCPTSALMELAPFWMIGERKSARKRVMGSWLEKGQDAAGACL